MTIEIQPLGPRLKEIAASIEDTMLDTHGRKRPEGTLILENGRPRTFGFDWHPVLFSMVSMDDLNQLAAYGGFPKRYPHYRFALEYERLRAGHVYGSMKISELVINTDPVYAYLVKGNQDIEHKLVMAHVYAHADFFKNNVKFSHTDKGMMTTMAVHRRIVMDAIREEGKNTVRAWIDMCKVLENLIDRYRDGRNDFLICPEEEPYDPRPELLPVPEGMERYKDFINPRDFVRKMRKKKKEQDELRRERERGLRIIEKPSLDVLGFLVAHAPVENWQRDMLEIVRNEALYFAPQAQTKIMNEGWAAYWDDHFVSEHFTLPEEELERIRHGALVRAKHPKQLNPYRLGYKIFEDIRKRWDKGRYTREYMECRRRDEREEWDTGEMGGLEKIFEVRATHNDVRFIRDFLTEELVAKEMIYTHDHDPQWNGRYIASKKVEDVRNTLLDQLANAGHPKVYVADVDRQRNLHLVHQHHGIDLHDDWAHTLICVAHIWKAPVYLTTIMDGKPCAYRAHKGKIKEADVGDTVSMPW